MGTIKQRWDAVFLIAAAVWLMGFSLRFPAETARLAGEALALCARQVVPSLFVFAVGAKLLIGADFAGFLARLPLGRVRRLFGVSGAGLAAFAIGLFAGFPVGAAVLASLVRRGEMEPREAEALLPFCNGAGASFVIGTVGGAFFGSVRLGVILFVSQTAAVFLALLLTAGKRRRSLPLSAPFAVKKVSFASVLAGAVGDGALAMISVTGFVTFFSVLSGSFSFLFHGEGSILFAFLGSFLEISGGLHALSAASAMPFVLRAGCAGFFLGFGGISVMMQVADRGETAGLSMKHYPAGKMLCGGICGILTAGMVLLGF